MSDEDLKVYALLNHRVLARCGFIVAPRHLVPPETMREISEWKRAATQRLHGTLLNASRSSEEQNR
jgi:hypothetical protein